jgi:hypothetical protein
MKAEIPAEVFTLIRELEFMVHKLEGRVDALSHRIDNYNKRASGDIISMQAHPLHGVQGGLVNNEIQS